MEPKPEEIEFDWVKLQEDMAKVMLVETATQKFVRKVKENPLVPVGALATVFALGYGLWCFRTGQRKMSQYMMRTRIAAQGLTVVALLIGVGISAKQQAESKPTT